MFDVLDRTGPAGGRSTETALAGFDAADTSVSGRIWLAVRAPAIAALDEMRVRRETPVMSGSRGLAYRSEMWGQNRPAD